MNKNYDKNRESEIYKNWVDKGYFRSAPNKGKKPYTIAIPPPNITDKLHIGHAFNGTIQDILIRFKRMQGFETLWVPGTDHAAISTEVIVMKVLQDEGTSKEEIGREAFLKRLWLWNEEYGGTIISQFKTLGFSCDWDRQRFTMDDGLNNAVTEVFVRLYNEGLVYKGERLVNWCVTCRTGISDAEVEHDDKEGFMYYFKYPVDGGGFLSFATTRPETMLGDTALAVSPEDVKFIDLVGKFVTIPIAGGRKIPIIADSYVDPEFGTGVVKITPAHDPNDFEVGTRHDIGSINILTDDGYINENGGEYKGLSREEAGKKVTEDMERLGLFEKSEKITHSVGKHDRCNTVIEPLIKLQWFVKMEELAKPALEAYTSGKLKFNRERFGKIYRHWLEIIKDWCISRQLWWGHRIPAYYCESGHITVSKETPSECATCKSTNLQQDPDVLDTWFSSALWPFSTLGWPDKTPELQFYYPTNTLVTAQEIIFNWVVRMVVMGLKFMGDIPFENVFINGTVVDENGIKMSKSLGNGIDPREIAEEFGADALRFMLVNGNAVDSNTRVYRERLEPARNFINKLWNATRFVLMNLEKFEISGSNAGFKDLLRNNPTLQTEDKWILSKMNFVIKDVTQKLETHELGLGVQAAVDFLWDDFCDWYVEIVKPRLTEKNADGLTACAVLVNVLTNITKLLHPVIPFVTEDLYSAIKPFINGSAESVMISSWPEANKDDFTNTSIPRVQEAVKAIRALRAQMEVPPSKKIIVNIFPEDASAKEVFTDSLRFINTLCQAESVTILDKPDESNSLNIVVPGATIFIPQDSIIDPVAEKARKEKERKKIDAEMAKLNGQLNNPGFLSKAPEHLVASLKERQEELGRMLEKL